MFKVISANVNGIRSAARKGFFDWLAEENADVVCLQEVKAQHAELAAELFHPAGYHVQYHCAEKKGYSGVGIYSRIKPLDIVTGLGFDTADQEGRYVAFNLGKFWVASLYLPSGTSGEERQAIKFKFLDLYAKHLQHLQEQGQAFIICGDWNIAHKQIDLKNWRGNQKNSGFLPEERAWMDQLFAHEGLGLVDTFRQLNQEPDQYTWWSNRGQAYAKNVGWRIDYQVATKGIAERAKNVLIYKNKRFSDHAPLIIEYDLK